MPPRPSQVSVIPMPQALGHMTRKCCLQGRVDSWSITDSDVFFCFHQRAHPS